MEFVEEEEEEGEGSKYFTVSFVVVVVVYPTSSASYPGHLVASDLLSHVIVAIVNLVLILNLPQSPPSLLFLISSILLLL